MVKEIPSKSWGIKVNKSGEREPFKTGDSKNVTSISSSAGFVENPFSSIKLTVIVEPTISSKYIWFGSAEIDIETGGPKKRTSAVSLSKSAVSATAITLANPGAPVESKIIYAIASPGSFLKNVIVSVSVPEGKLPSPKTLKFILTSVPKSDLSTGVSAASHKETVIVE